MLGTPSRLAIHIAIPSILEMGAQGKMIDVNTTFVGTNDVPDDFAYGDAAFMANPDEAGYGHCPKPDFDRGTPIVRECAGPFDAAFFIGRPAEVGNALDERATRLPIIAGTRELAFWKVIDCGHGYEECPMPSVESRGTPGA